jgi:hypothetical protein
MNKLLLGALLVAAVAGTARSFAPLGMSQASTTHRLHAYVPDGLTAEEYRRALQGYGPARTARVHVAVVAGLAASVREGPILAHLRPDQLQGTASEGIDPEGRRPAHGPGRGVGQRRPGGRQAVDVFPARPRVKRVPAGVGSWLGLDGSSSGPIGRPRHVEARPSWFQLKL